MDELLKQVEIVKAFEAGSKGRPNRNPILRELKTKLNALALPLMEDKMNLVVGGYVLEKYFDRPRNRDWIMIFTKDSFNRREEYNRQRTLNWIKP